MRAEMAGAVSILILAASLSLPAQALAATVDVEITPGALNKTTDAYSPNPIEINVGDTVVWTNSDSTLHTVSSGTASDPTHVFGDDESGNPKYIAPNQTFEFTFTEEGEFDYYCTLHPAMVGTVIVGDGIGDGIFTKNFELVQQGTAKIKKVTYDISLAIKGEYLYDPSVGKPQIDSDELVGTLTIDGADFDLKDIKVKVSGDMKKVSISGKVDEPALEALDISGSVSTTLKFSSAINFAEAEDAISVEKGNTMTIVIKGLKSPWSGASKDSTGFITF
jgi:plastocyanin